MGLVGDLGTFGPVPDGSDRGEVLDWAIGCDPYRDGAVARARFEQALGVMSWHRVERTRSHDDGDSFLLSREVASMAAGLWHLGGVVGLVATGGRAGLDLRLGIAAVDPSPALAAVTSNLPGTAVRQGVGFPPCPWQPRGSLRAVPDPEPEPSGLSILDRLTRLNGVEWRLSALLVPVPQRSIHEHAVQLTALAERLAQDRSRQVQVTPVSTAIHDDPGIERLAGAVEVELERTTTAHHSGAFATVVSIAAADPAQLATVVGCATSAAPALTTAWHFVVPEPTADLLPVTTLGSTELVDLLRPPTHDVLGLPRQRSARLDEHVDQIPAGVPQVRLGVTERGAPAVLPLRLLGHHVLVTGATGSGKSSFVAQLLLRLAASGIPFLVIEPVKQEWHGLGVPELRRWALGAPDPGLPWGLNPLEVPDGTAVATHIDHLVALFRTSFGLPDPLPYLVELGLQRVYEGLGWDLGADRRLGPSGAGGDLEWPTLGALLEVCLALPAELRYDSQIQGNLRAALLARLGGLTRGPRGRALDTTARFPIEEVLGGPLVVNLDAVGDDHARSFLMGLLLIRLVEARRAEPSRDLEHVTVVEEAHRLMGRKPTNGGAGSSDPVGGTADRFGDLLSEIRATGEGLVVLDQSPTALVRGAIVNTAAQIALRTKDRDDQAALAAAMGLPDGAERILSSLEVDEAVVAWEGMDAPIRVRLDTVRLPSAPPPASAPQAVRLSGAAPATRRAARAFVRVGPREHQAARSTLLDAIRAEHPGLEPSSLAALLADAVHLEVAALARARLWGRDRRERAERSVLGGRYDEDHPSRALLDGLRPRPGCAAACPQGGCLLGEAVEPEAAAILTEGPATLVRLVASPEEARRRLRRRVLDVLPAAAPAELHDLALSCAAVQVFDDWADPETVGSLVAAVTGGRR